MAQIFHQFPKLPPKIRVQIWKTYSNVPRTIRLAGKIIGIALTACELFQGFYTAKNGLEENCRPPALLSVNRESRHEGLKYYTLQLCSWPNWIWPHCGVYLNRATDSIYTYEFGIGLQLLLENLDHQLEVRDRYSLCRFLLSNGSTLRIHKLAELPQILREENAKTQWIPS